jgi:hypothetical protein
LCGWGFILLYLRIRDWRGRLLIALSLLCFVRLGVSAETDQHQRYSENYEALQHDVGNVPQKP